MTTYLGNASLSTAVKERVLSTFQQALTLYKQGRTEEVVQGCGLILRMDPMFDPAKRLLEKAKNPAAAIDVESLTPTTSTAAALQQARQAMAARDFQRAVNITTDILTNDLMNEDARQLNEKARERLEAGPFIDQFVRKAEQSIASGNSASARIDVDKIRSLDPEHPALGRLEQAIGQASAPAQSFVVDGPAAPPRSSAQASDFGFTFEEEKQQAPFSAPAASPFSTDTGKTAPVTPPGGFSFDSPQPSAPASPEEPFGSLSYDSSKPAEPHSPFGDGGFSFDSPAAPKVPTRPPASAEFDFTTASIETSPDDQKKIQQYLADGDRAFQAGNPQQAIDLWSRIFLIDVTNEEASARIDGAKTKRRETDKRVEVTFANAMGALRRGDKAAAREGFTEVLRIDPGNAGAQEQLEKIGNVPTEGGATAFETPYVPPPPTQPDIFDEAVEEGSYQSPVAPIPVRRVPVVVSKAPAKPARTAPIGAIAVVVIVAVLGFGGWFVWSRFMNKPAAQTGTSDTILTEATTLSQKGQYDAAIALLQDVKPEDPQHDKALSMIADLQRKKGQASEMVDGRPAGIVYQEGVTSGKAAFDARDYDAAKKAFDSAARVRPLPPDIKAMYDIAAQQVSKLDSAKALFKEGRYNDALGNLDALSQQDPQNQSVKRMITDAHFNMGATALQEDKLTDAAREFDEVLKRDPADELAKRSKALAERYQGQPKDLLYRIYVKYLPLRTVT
jgi:tetratricopeptide (TPR) repeat protein